MKRIIIEYNGELTERLILAVMEVLNPKAAENGMADEKLNRFTIQYDAEDSESLTMPLLMAAMKAQKLNHMETLKGCTDVYLDNGGEFKRPCTESSAEDAPADETEEIDYYDSMFYYYRNLEKEAFDGKASDDDSTGASGRDGGQNHEENNH